MILSIKIIAVLVVLLQILYWNVIFRKVKEKKGAYPNEKKVTLIICVKNDWNKIKANQLQFNNLQGVDEIIFIDDHSIGGIPSDFEEIWQNKISKVFPNKGTGKKFALETGIKLAQNDWILLTDADCARPQRRQSLWRATATEQQVSENHSRHLAYRACARHSRGDCHAPIPRLPRAGDRDAATGR